MVSGLQVRETMLGAVDSTVLERMAKIMSYMSLAGVGGKKGRGCVLRAQGRAPSQP